MKIGILGAGTASAISLLKIFELLKTYYKSQPDIYCLYDPNIPITHVGESTSPVLSGILFRVLDFNAVLDLKEFDGTLRWSTNYAWEEANGNNFWVMHGNPGLHINSEKFASYVIKKLSEKYSNFYQIHDNVVSVDQDTSGVTVSCSEQTYKFDYLIDCRGNPSPEELASDEYTISPFQSVNSVILYPHFHEYKEDYTSAYYHKNGWMFGVPLAHRKAYGYLYNNNITSYEEACKHFAEIKGIDTTNLRKFSWQSYYKNKVIDGRILYIGNRLYFFEPAQALPLHHYMNIAEGFIDKILIQEMSVDRMNIQMNQYHLVNVEMMQDLIAMNYVGRIDNPSEFWSYTKESAVKRLKNSVHWQDWLQKNKLTNGILGYWRHDNSIMTSYVKGYDIDLDSLLN